MTDELSRLVAKELLAKTGHKLSLSLSEQLSATSAAISEELLRALIGPGFGVKITLSPPLLTVWKEPREGGRYDG